MNKIETKGDVSYLHIHSKKYGKFTVIIDTEDVDRVNKFKWSIGIHIRETHSNPYAVNNQHGPLHKLIFGNHDNQVIDHINRNTLDNRKSNLRSISYRENTLNSKKYSSNTTGYRNVCYLSKRDRYKVAVRHQDKTKIIGYYKCKNEAARVANMARRMYYGPSVEINTIK